MTYISTQTAAQAAFSYQSAIITFFRSKNALSAEHAIEVEELDWLQMGFSPSIDLSKQLKLRQDIIKATPDGKYWLDVSGFARAQYKQGVMLSNIFIIIGLFMFALSAPFALMDQGDPAPPASMLVFGFIFMAIGVLMRRELRTPPPTQKP